MLPSPQIWLCHFVNFLLNEHITFVLRLTSQTALRWRWDEMQFWRTRTDASSPWRGPTCWRPGCGWTLREKRVWTTAAWPESGSSSCPRRCSTRTTACSSILPREATHCFIPPDMVSLNNEEKSRKESCFGGFFYDSVGSTFPSNVVCSVHFICLFFLPLISSVFYFHLISQSFLCYIPVFRFILGLISPILKIFVLHKLYNKCYANVLYDYKWDLK